VTPIGSAGPDCATFLARSPAGDLYAVTGTSDLVLARVDTTTGALTTIGPLGVSITGPQFVGVTFDPAGRLWAVANAATGPCSASGSTCLYSLDPGTGAATLIGGSAIGPTTGLAADCTNVYAATWDDSALYRVDTTTASFTEIGPTGVTPALQGLSFAPDGTLWALGAMVGEGPFHSFTVDTTTGTATEVATLTGYAENPLDQGGFATALPTCPPATPLVPAAPEPLPVVPAFTG
jgi:hypothetical protein